ncbi:hypothetical protein GCM10009541_44370 [Micromonospora gifhornensis]|uniref:Uncharacterized protein n=1 Tax=Micromonospora gifhornensis TaxID=84594 RepID=A0ABQ4IN14_9ACTN|nr:hypothetical protein Vgi01_59860 [Micromonospora gifhornensis]
MDGSGRTLCWEILRDDDGAAPQIDRYLVRHRPPPQHRVTGCYTSPPASPVPPDDPFPEEPATRRVAAMPICRTNHKERSTSGVATLGHI